MHLLFPPMLRCIPIVCWAFAGLLLLLVSAGPLSPAFAEAPKATAARLAGDINRTRFVADLERPVSFSAYVLADPYRVILDLPGVDFQLGPGAGTKGRGLVSAYRFGALEPGKSRIIMDVKGPVLIEKAQIIPPENGQPSRLVVDVVKTSKATFKRLQQREQQTARAKVVAVPKPGPRTIILDPGHGGADPGAIAVDGTQEKEITLAFARALKSALEKTGKYRVLLTRETDVFLSLDDRVDFARNAKADLFLALHADVARGASVRGATIYTLSETASDAEAEALASKENRADVMAGTLSEEQDINSILLGLAQRDSANNSAAFARRLAVELGKVTKLTPKPIRSAGFRVLRAPDVPSVLLELGFLSDIMDAGLLASPQWRARAAAATARAIHGHFASSSVAAGP